MTQRANYIGSNGKYQSRLAYSESLLLTTTSHLEESTYHATDYQPRKPSYDRSAQYQQTNLPSYTSMFNTPSSKPFNERLPHKTILGRQSEQKQAYITSQARYHKDFERNDHHLCRQINQAPTKPEGLPNIGNTCFLNSSLQFLYAVHQIRSKLIDSYHTSYTKNRYNYVLSLIAQIFSLLQKKEKYSYCQKARILEKIICFFQESDYGYKKYLQEDALKIFITIINLIDDNAFRIEKDFLVSFSYRCNCMSGPLLMSSILFFDDELCDQCKMPVDKQILKTQKYLLMVSKYDNEKIINGFPYQWLSKILFKSYTQSFGHYVCLRKENGRVYELNDNTVSDISKKEQERKYKSYRPQSNEAMRLILYRKKQ